MKLPADLVSKVGGAENARKIYKRGLGAYYSSGRRYFEREKVMPYGKGTYGSKVGRPSKKDKMDPKLRKAAMKKMAAKKKKPT